MWWRRRLGEIWRVRCGSNVFRIARRVSSLRCETSGKAAARRRLLLRLNAAVVLQPSEVVHQWNEAVVHRRIVDEARVRYRVQRRHVNSRVTIAVSQRHGQSGL